VLYRASMCDMVCPYGDPHPQHFRKERLRLRRVWDRPVANSLALGCDCLGEIRYLTPHGHEPRRRLYDQNAICLPRGGLRNPLEAHGLRTTRRRCVGTGGFVVSSSRQSATTSTAFLLVFQQDGMIQFEVKLTGIMHTGALPPGEKAAVRAAWSRPSLRTNHQHMFNGPPWDMMVDGGRKLDFSTKSHGKRAP